MGIMHACNMITKPVSARRRARFASVRSLGLSEGGSVVVDANRTRGSGSSGSYFLILHQLFPSVFFPSSSHLTIFPLHATQPHCPGYVRLLSGCGKIPAAVKFCICHSGALSVFHVQKIHPVCCSYASNCASIKLARLFLSVSLKSCTVPVYFPSQEPT